MAINTSDDLKTLMRTVELMNEYEANNKPTPAPVDDTKWFKLAAATVTVWTLLVLGTVVCRHYRVEH